MGLKAPRELSHFLFLVFTYNPAEARCKVANHLERAKLEMVEMFKILQAH